MFKYLIALIFSTSTFVSQPLQNDNGWRPAWGLDRIDQREANLNDTYNYSLTGSGVTVYVFDSGINSSHNEFPGRVKPGFSVINDGYSTEDCTGHGTHSASLIGGSIYGVAKNVQLVPVRVLNCSNSNSSSVTLFTAIDWIVEHHEDGVPAVVNMSVGMSKSIAFNEAVQKLIADGLIVVAAAGNQNRDACLYSPASELSVISVGGTDRAELRASYSNYGACVDIFAPGSDLVGGWIGAPDTYRSSSGTSNAAPIVSGIVALMLEDNPSLTQSQVEQKLKDNATRDAVFNIGLNSSNLLAYSFFGTNNSLPSTTTVPTPVIETTTTTIAPQPVIVTTTTLAPQPVSTTTTFVPSSPTTVQIDLTCFKPAERTRFFNVPYVCVNTGNQLMWIPQRYSPGRP
jgi:subtilisin family serine protease